MALALLKNYHPRLWRRMTGHGNRMLAGGLALAGVTFWLFLDDRHALPITVIGFPMLALSFSMLIVAALSRDSVLRTARIPGAASLALWSYAIYLGHKQLCILAKAPLQELGYGPNSAVAIAVMMFISVFAGWVLYRCVETPFMALRARYVPTNFAPEKR